MSHFEFRHRRAIGHAVNKLRRALRLTSTTCGARRFHVSSHPMLLASGELEAHVVQVVMRPRTLKADACNVDESMIGRLDSS